MSRVPERGKNVVKKVIIALVEGAERIKIKTIKNKELMILGSFGLKRWEIIIKLEALSSILFVGEAMKARM